MQILKISIHWWFQLCNTYIQQEPVDDWLNTVSNIKNAKHNNH